jgi:hypothetical protein
MLVRWIDPSCHFDHRVGSFKRRKRGLGFAALSWQSRTTYRVSEAGRAGSEFQQLRQVEIDRKK